MNQIPITLIEFMRAVRDAGAYISYGGFHSVCQELGISKKNSPVLASLKALHKLPSFFQIRVLRPDGTVDLCALKDWGIPETHLQEYRGKYRNRIPVAKEGSMTYMDPPSCLGIFKDLQAEV